MTPLERHYGWFMVAYPKSYRHRRGDEIMATLLESADPSRSWPSAGDAVDLLGHGLRMRLGLTEGQPIGRLMLMVGPCQLVMASLMAAIALIFAEWGPFSPWPWIPPGHLGPFFTAGAVVYFGWVLAGLSLLVNRPRLTRGLVALSMGSTAVLAPICHLLALGRPAMFYLVFLVVLGIPYVAVPNQGSAGNGWRRSQNAMLALPLLPAMAISAEMAWLSGASQVIPGPFFYRYEIGAFASWITWLDAGALVVAAVCVIVGRRLLGAAIALLCLPWVTLWTGNHLSRYVTGSQALTGIVLASLSLLIIGLFAVGPRRHAWEEPT